MPKSSKPRKKYRPALGSRTHLLIPRVVNTRSNPRTLSHLIPHEALRALVDGVGAEPEVSVVAFRVNVGYVLVTRHMESPEAETLLESAMDVLRNLQVGRQARVVISESQASTLGIALTLVDDIHDHTSNDEQRWAMLYVASTAGAPKTYITT